MKLLLSADTHGKVPEITEKVDLALIAGDFAKGDALRKMIFEKGDPEVAKKEILESSKEFLSKIKQLNCPIVVSLGNAEEFCKEDVIKMIKAEGINYKKNSLIILKGIKILSLNFFVEEWWARKYRAERQQTIDRAIKEEKELNEVFDKIKSVDIIISHLPPYGVLDEDQGLNNKGDNAGSKLLRNFILKIKPKLVVCGHIHVPGEVKLGETLIINPGEQKVIEFNNKKNKK